MTEDSPERKARIARIAERMYGKPMAATYHPIDKPTEPGWYWLCEHGARWELVRVTQAGWSYRPTREPTADLEMWQINNDGFMARSKVTPSHNGHGSFGSSQWFGPAIQPPETAKSSGNSPSAQNGREAVGVKITPEAPRRFRCRCVGESTWGVFDGHKYFVMLPSSLSFSASLDPPQEIEWLDLEPKKPPKSKSAEWPRLFRWRNTLSITSVTYGFGLYFREADEYVVLLGNGTMKVCKHSPHKYEIFEWLDTENP